MADLVLPLRSSRLTFRALSEDDLDAHLRLFGDPEVVRYLYDEVMDRPAAAEHLQRRLPARLPGEGEWMNLAIEHEGRYIGEVGVGQPSACHRQWEIGYVLLPEVWGQGLGSEAAIAMTDLAFACGAHRVSGRIDARNDASARVLERVGMRREAHLRENEFVKGEWTDEVVYAITEDEWAARRSQGVRLQ